MFCCLKQNTSEQNIIYMNEVVCHVFSLRLSLLYAEIALHMKYVNVIIKCYSAFLGQFKHNIR